jgi:Ala-tRNA(Pro) deacylase
MHTDATLCAFLDEHGIAFRRYDHEPVFTCEQAEPVVPADVGAVHTKNIFVRDKKGRRHWLVVTTCAKAVDLKALAGVLGADTLSFASPERLQRLLGVTPGAVTILGLVNDAAHEVELVVDEEVWSAESLRAHPLVNTATLVLSRTGAGRFCALTGHQARVVRVPARVGS